MFYDLAFVSLLSLVCIQLRITHWISGGDKRDRTADPLLAKQVLSQLSYTPVYLLKVAYKTGPSKLNNESNGIHNADLGC